MTREQAPTVFHLREEQARLARDEAIDAARAQFQTDIAEFERTYDLALQAARDRYDAVIKQIEADERSAVS